MNDRFEILLQAATEIEYPFIQEAAIRAGLMWECHCHWLGLGDEEDCNSCGYHRNDDYCETCDWFPRTLDTEYSYTRNAHSCVGGELP